MALGRTGLALLALMALALPRVSPAAALPEAQVKAAFIFNFLLFTRWPAGTAQSPLRLCLAGDDAVAKALRQLDGHTLGTGKVQVTRTEALTSACHAVYLSAPARKRWSDWLQSPRARGVLSITDGGNQLDASGSILVVAAQNDRVVFELDLEQARRQKLGFGARILQLARQNNAP